MKIPQVVVLQGAMLLAAAAALAQSPADAGGPGLGNSQKLLEAMLGLFVAATVVEFALSALFQWRLYRELFNGRAVKTVVTVAVCLVIVKTNNYDIFARIMADAGGSGAQSWLSVWLSAFILAGGSAGVNRLLRSLGFRPPADLPPDRPAPPETQAWVSVRVIQRKALGMVNIGIEQIETPTADDLLNPPLAGLAQSHSFRGWSGSSLQTRTAFRPMAERRFRRVRSIASLPPDSGVPLTLEIRSSPSRSRYFGVDLQGGR
jgi:hypothetical protein